jgi:hypothetical protein
MGFYTPKRIDLSIVEAGLVVGRDQSNDPVAIGLGGVVGLKTKLPPLPGGLT